MKINIKFESEEEKKTASRILGREVVEDSVDLDDDINTRRLFSVLRNNSHRKANDNKE